METPRRLGLIFIYTCPERDNSGNRGDALQAKLYIYPYRIEERKLHPILWSFDKEALNEIAKRFENKSVFSVKIREKTIILKFIE